MPDTVGDTLEHINILILGSGAVAKPCVDYLLRDSKNILTVGCRTLATAEKVTDTRPNTKAIRLDVTSPGLDTHIAQIDLVISLVPFIHHADVIRSAIKGRTNVVTASYVSPAMRELDEDAKKAGIVVLNEVGMDPGIDHLYAIKTIGEVHDKGGKVKEFYSYCGGLVAPEAANNPLQFKFSWSPRGALLSQQNSASFLKDGQVVTIANTDLMAQAKPYHVMDGYSFVAYPNRDSVPFREAYQVLEAHTVIRGSLRYKNNPSLVRALIDLGWLDQEAKPWLSGPQRYTWAEIQQKATGAESCAEEHLLQKVDERCHFVSEEARARTSDGLRWMGLFSDEQPAVLHNTLIDTLSTQLERLCSLQPGDWDLVMLQHKFVVEWKDGSKNTITSTLELFGDPDGYTAMSKSVGITCGIATQLLLDGFGPLNQPGVLAPYTREICDAIRVKVEAEGIRLVEKMF